MPIRFRDPKTLITHARLLELVEYRPETGEFIWASERPKYGRIFKGDVIKGSFSGDGYSLLCLDAKVYGASRLAWFYVYGEWPMVEVDHIDTDKLNNRLDNLRIAPSRSLQCGNQGARCTNEAGLKGVRQRGTKWQARIVDQHLGCFNTPEEAHAAYLRAARERFGEYARSG